MEVPPADATEPLSQYSAVQLFLRSAVRVQRGFEPTADDLIQVARICQLVEGMPLAILLAVSWMTMLTPGEIAAQVSERSLEILETEGQDVPARQRSMRAVLGHSWDLLSEQGQAVLAGLSVFRGGFRQQAAQQVTGASMRELRTLVSRSLLQRTPMGRYEIHELLRQYAAERLALSSVAEEAVRERHSAYYAAALQRWDADLRGPRQAEAMAEMMAEAGNARVAWEWAVEQRDVARIGQAMDGLCRFYERRGRYREGEAACRLAAARLTGRKKELPGDGLQALIRVWTWQGFFSMEGWGARAGVSRRLLEQGLALLDDPALTGRDTRPERAFLLQQMGRTWMDSDLEEAGRWIENSLALYRALGKAWGTANLLSDLGYQCMGTGQHGRAREVFQESLALRRSLGDQMGIAYALEELSWACEPQGQFDRAEDLAREAVAVYQRIGDRVGVLHGFFTLASQLQNLGRFAETHKLLKDIAAAYHELGMHFFLHLYVENRLGETDVHLGLYEQARALFEENLAFGREVSSRAGIGPAIFLRGLGQIALVEQTYDEAWRHLQESAAVLREAGYRAGLAGTLLALAHAERGLGQKAQARQDLLEGMRTAVEIGHFRSCLVSLPLMALLLADRGEVERAVELCALASRYPYVANSRWFEDVAGRHIASAASTLPPEVVEAAQERGRVRNLEATIAELLKELEASGGGWPAGKGAGEEVGGPCPS